MKDQRIGRDAPTVEGPSLILADFATKGDRAAIEGFVADLIRSLTGNTQVYPDFAPPLVLMGDEDPLPQIRAAATPRYSYRQLRKAAGLLNDRLKGIPSVGRVTQIGVVQEAIHLYYSQQAGGYPLSFDQVTGAIAARNALIPSGTLHTQASDFPVQLSRVFASDRELLDTIIGQIPRGTPVYLRDVVEVERGYQDPLPTTVDVPPPSGRTNRLAPERAVLVAVQMKEGSIIRTFDEEVNAALAQLRPQAARRHRRLSDLRPADGRGTSHPPVRSLPVRGCPRGRAGRAVADELAVRAAEWPWPSRSRPPWP